MNYNGVSSDYETSNKKSEKKKIDTKQDISKITTEDQMSRKKDVTI